MGSRSQEDLDLGADSPRPVLHDPRLLERNLERQRKNLRRNSASEKLINKLLPGFGLWDFGNVDGRRPEFRAVRDRIEYGLKVRSLVSLQHFTANEGANRIATDQLELPHERLFLGEIRIYGNRRRTIQQSGGISLAALVDLAHRANHSSVVLSLANQDQCELRNLRRKQLRLMFLLEDLFRLCVEPVHMVLPT